MKEGDKAAFQQHKDGTNDVFDTSDFKGLLVTYT
jgi:hypothetical protein